MPKYGKIYTDPKDGKEYFVIEDESKQAKDTSHLVVITSRESVVLREREGRTKTDKNHEHSGFKDERISTFKGYNAPVHAVNYLVQKYNIPQSAIRERQ